MQLATRHVHSGQQPARRSPAAERPVTRVLFIAHDASLFGAQRMLLTLLENVDRRSFQCRVVTPDDGEFADRVQQLGIAVHRRALVRWVPEQGELTLNGRWNELLRVCQGLRARAWAVARLIENHNIDVVFTNTVTVLEGAIAALMTSKPHIWHIHEPIQGNPELGSLVPQSFYEMAIRQLASRVVFPSRSLETKYRLLNSRSTVIHNGLALPWAIDRPAARSRLTSLLGIAPDTRVVTTVGAIHPRKDHTTFLRAAEQVAAVMPDVKFLIIGCGHKQAEQALASEVARRNLSQRVLVLGRWHGDICEVLAACNVLVISSIQESFGLTAIEALSVQTPVIATRCGGPEEILHDGIDSELVPIGAFGELAQAIMRLLTDCERARAYGSAGRANVLKRFTAEAYVSAFERLLSETCNGHRHKLRTEYE